jgi:hypothetical protein
MKAKDNIEEIILQNIEKLNDSEPTDGHFDRFQEKLNNQNKKRKVNFSIIWKVAAAVIFVLLATNQAAIYFSPNNQGLFVAENDTEISLSSVSSEYEEVEYYYNNAINVGLNQWNSLNSDGLISEEEQLMMDEEFSEFETLYKNLQDDLKSNPNDERVVNAMLEYYEAKLSVINMIVTKLQEVKQINKNHENEI